MPVGTVTRQHDVSTTAMGGNVPYSGLTWRPSRKPEYHVYLYNVSARTFPSLGRLNVPVPGVIEDDPVLPGMAENEKYHYVTSFPQPILTAKPNLESNEINYVEEDAVRFVIDLISPDNLTRSLDTVIPPNTAFSIGNDLAQKGVFFSLSNPPEQADVQHAIARMEKYYRFLNERADALALTDQATLSTELSANPDYVYADRYFGRNSRWAKQSVRPSECPNCGEQISAKRKFHVNQSLGFVCVEPTMDGWKAVVAAGVKKYEDVPDEFAWKPKRGGPSKLDQMAAELRAQQGEKLPE